LSDRMIVAGKEAGDDLEALDCKEDARTSL
jgi:hypothetical protein